MHPNVHSSIIYKCEDMRATKMSINRSIDQEDVGCVYMYVCICVYVYVHVYVYIYPQTIMQYHGGIKE